MTTYPNADSASTALISSVTLIRQELATMIVAGLKIDNALQILGTIAVATDDSGTLDFTNESNSALIAAIAA